MWCFIFKNCLNSIYKIGLMHNITQCLKLIKWFKPWQLLFNYFKRVVHKRSLSRKICSFRGHSGTNFDLIHVVRGLKISICKLHYKTTTILLNGALSHFTNAPIQLIKENFYGVILRNVILLPSSWSKDLTSLEY